MTEILAVLLVTAVACSLIGVFSVLRNLSMLSDAISHSILLGIVLAYMIHADLTSPLLFAGAVIMGIVTVFSTELLLKTGGLKEDAAVGIVFPFFFSIGVILISRYLSNTHLCVDTVLMGEVLMAPFRRVDFFGWNIPLSLRNLGLILTVNLIFVVGFYKELKLATFDPEYAQVSGFSLTLIHYLVTTLISLTAVAAFDAVGTILVISFLVAPAASAALVTKKLKHMIIAAAAYACANTLIGYFLALRFNVNISGMIATVAGMTFFLTVLVNPQGLITGLVRRHQQRKQLLSEFLIAHMGNHIGSENESEELGVETICDHMKWNCRELHRNMKDLIAEGFAEVDVKRQMYRLTDKGRAAYQKLGEYYGW